MTQPLTSETRSGRRWDPFAVAAGAFLLAALAFGVYPALKAGPGSLGGLLLLTGLAGVAFFAILALRGQSAGPIEGLDIQRLMEAVRGPLAIATPDGRILSANPAWAAAVGDGGRLPKSVDAGGLFAAIAAARRGEAGLARLRMKRADRDARISLLDQRRVLVELLPPKSEPASAAAPAPAAAAAASPSGPDAFVASAPVGAALLEGDALAAVIVRANAALETMAGHGPLAGETLASLIEPESWAEAASGIAAGRAGPFEVKLARDGKAVAQLHLTHAPEGLTAYLIDISERKEIELKLAQSEKMRAMGDFVGGVSHDFNNLLSGVQLKLDELFLAHPVGDPSYQDLVEARSATNRAAGLVRSLLAYSRKQTVQREVLELGELVSEVEVLLRRLMREDVVLETEYGRNLPLILGDRSQFEMALMNLAVNARDALHAEGGGIVRIKTARLTSAEAKALGYDDQQAPPGDVAMIEVADNGPGISPDAVDKIFDPFFTTKPVGEGTGLGLATVYGIVKQAAGWIHLENRPGEGATFRIFLPVHIPLAAAITPAMRMAPAKAPARDLSGVGRILFVEDEAIVRTPAAKLLRRCGYEVLEAGDGHEAMTVAAENAGKIDLLISDVMMPGIDGPTFLRQARPYLGDAPVLFISGYAEAEFSDLLEGETGVSFLPKPLDIKTLAERVKQVLQTSAAA
ncbi:MAG TPA: ATP-binding protein [Caulobacteraceae bacterium]|nr:ATP-binding protein [Caulobacteraceae bacterium]